MCGLHLILSPLQFLVCRRLRLYTTDFFQQGFLDGFNFFPGFDERVEVEQAGISLHEAVFGSDRQRNFLVIHETLIQQSFFRWRVWTRGCSGHMNRCRVVRNPVSHHDKRNLGFAFQEETTFPALFRFQAFQKLGVGPFGIGSNNLAIVGISVSALISPTTTSVALLGE